MPDPKNINNQSAENNNKNRNPALRGNPAFHNINPKPAASAPNAKNPEATKPPAAAPVPSVSKQFENPAPVELPKLNITEIDNNFGGADLFMEKGHIDNIETAVVSDEKLDAARESLSNALEETESKGNKMQPPMVVYADETLMFDMVYGSN